jgi:hypothetical protein
MHVGAYVAINAKGGDCWKIFNRQLGESLSLMARTTMEKSVMAKNSDGKNNEIVK